MTNVGPYDFNETFFLLKMDTVQSDTIKNNIRAQFSFFNGIRSRDGQLTEDFITLVKRDGNLVGVGCGATTNTLNVDAVFSDLLQLNRREISDALRGDVATGISHLVNQL